jgi:nucleoid DNA-binding protein
VTKQDLAKKIVAQCGLSRKDSVIVIDAILETISIALSEGEKIELRGFGSFMVKKVRARNARNPRTGDSVLVQSKLKPYFKVSRGLKKAVSLGHELDDEDMLDDEEDEEVE